MEMRKENVGFLTDVFSAITIETLGESLKAYMMRQEVTEDSSPGLLLTGLVGEVVKQTDYKEYKRVSKHLFYYQDVEEETMEVVQLPDSQEEWQHIKENIDYLLR